MLRQRLKRVALEAVNVVKAEPISDDTVELFDLRGDVASRCTGYEMTVNLDAENGKSVYGRAA